MSETVRLLPPGQDCGACDEPIDAKAWKNITFDRDGRSYLGRYIHPSEEAARQRTAEAIAHISAEIASGRFPNGRWALNDCPFENYSHTLQLPWKP